MISVSVQAQAGCSHARVTTFQSSLLWPQRIQADFGLRGRSTLPARSRRLSCRSTLTAPPQTELPQYEEGDLPVPAWVGDRFLSRVFNVLISFGPFYGLMKQAARNVLIQSAESNGIPWTAIVEELRAALPQLQQEKERLENPTIQYPEYYLKPFHAYPEGNLCWQAAFEVEPATLSLYKRALPWARDTLEGAELVRGAWLGAIRRHHERYSGGLEVDAILDIGCSTGLSSRYFATTYPTARVVGLDASSYFLAVASYRAKQAAPEWKGEGAAMASEGLLLGPASGTGVEGSPVSRIEWVHGLGEATGLPAQSFSMVSFAFVLHECPGPAIRALLKEAKRLLKPGGTVSMTDNSPRSKVIQSMPAPIAALMKTTEPHSDSYYQVNLESLMVELGFSNPITVLGDPRHRVVTATA